jgi:peptidyl-prolyl cis-trans isomerase SurA
VIFKVVEHVQGGVPQYKDVQPQVEEALLHEPHGAGHARLPDDQMREEAYIDIKPGYTDSAASTQRETKPLQRVYATRAEEKEEGSADPLPRDRARFPQQGDMPTWFRYLPIRRPPKRSGKRPRQGRRQRRPPTTMKAGKKEKIRYGQAPRETLPNAAPTKVEDAGALPKDREC